MKLEEVHDLWKEDSRIDKSELGDESLRTPSLHHKWLKMYSEHKLELKKMEAAVKVLRWKKLNFYTNGPDEETQKLGWKLPPRGRILKTEAAGYVEADPDVLSAGEVIAHQVEVVDALESILKAINNRGFNIKNALEWNRFINGG